jgi:K+-sensing histidine kinase KdpD
VDVIAWVVGLVAGFLLPSLWAAFGVAAATSIAIRVYQYFFTDPQVWRAEFPADWIGAAAMIVVSCLFAYVGSLVRGRRAGRSASE